MWRGLTDALAVDVCVWVDDDVSSVSPQLCVDLKSKDVATTFKKVVSKRENLETLGGMSHASSEGKWSAFAPPSICPRKCALTAGRD